ncbi:hypothetical protein [Methanosphaera sp.]|nr:hypothetical protein [Methanosphaera sp.]MDO5822717.1 hypothetical protein [Methanosphaera sp.]
MLNVVPSIFTVVFRKYVAPCNPSLSVKLQLVIVTSANLSQLE